MHTTRMNLRTIIGLSLLLVSSVFADTVDVYFLAGQSNMQGCGKLSELNGQANKPLAKVYFFNGKSFELLVPGQTQTSDRAQSFGPEIGFATELSNSQPSTASYLIKYAADGMPLHHGWNGNKWADGEPVPKRLNFYPGTHPSDPNTGLLYQQMISRFQQGLTAIRAAGHTPVVRGLVWMQGEQDSKHAKSTAQYAHNLRALRDRVEQDTSAYQLSLIYGQVLPYTPAKARFTHRDEIRNQMKMADQDSQQPLAIPRAKMVSTDHFPLLKDTVHYNSEGQLMLGSAMAKAAVALRTKIIEKPLWDNTVPGFPVDYAHQAPKAIDKFHHSELSQPYLRIFPATAQPTGQAVVIFPGGGYRLLSHYYEGDKVAQFLAAQGHTCFVVNYRVSRGNHPGFRFPGPLLDARQGIRLAKQLADKLDFSADKVGVIGFSAGGHLASMCATRFHDNFANERLTHISVRPAFAGLIYPVASLKDPTSHTGSKKALFGAQPNKKELVAASAEARVDAKFPPIFITHNQFDFVDSQLSLNLAKAYTKAKVPCELHLYPAKDHGFGIGRGKKTEKQNPALNWPALFCKFLQRLN